MTSHSDNFGICIFFNVFFQSCLVSSFNLLECVHLFVVFHDALKKILCIT
jgi:hypothetical protein